MTVVLLVEGDTESALREHLKRFLDQSRVAHKDHHADAQAQAEAAC
jgi:hypothetical protein